MRVEFYDDVAETLDIAAPPRCRVAVTTHKPLPPAELALLTEGQRDCLRLVYNHMTSKDIARILGVSPHTVDMRLRTAMKTLAVGSRIEAARLLVQDEAGGEVMPDAYQPLIYHPPEIESQADSSILGSSASSGAGDLAHHDHQARFSPVVDPNGSGPPRSSFASGSLDTEHSTIWAGALATDPGVGARPMAGSVPWGKKNDLSIGARLGWIVLIAIGSSLAFGSILGAIAALKTLH